MNEAGRNVGVVEVASKGSSILVYLASIVLFIIVIGAFSAFAYVAFQSIGAGAFSSAMAPKSGADANIAEATVSGLFGTIQFSLSVLSGVIIVFAAIISFVVGRSARQTQEATRIELNELARLYRENLDAVSSSIPTTVRYSIDKYLGEVDPTSTLDSYKEKLEELSAKYDEIAPVVDNYKEFKRASQELEIDYGGPLFQMMEDDRNRGGDTELDRDKRIKIQQTLLGIQEGALRRQVTANMAFNAAQSAARHQFNESSHRLAVLANWLQPSAMHEARLARSEYESGDRYTVERAGDNFRLVSQNTSNDPDTARKIRQNALDNVLRLASNAVNEDCEFIINEAWNLCNAWNHLGEMILSFERALAASADNGRYIPSYMHIMLARAYSHRGNIGWQEDAGRHFQLSLDKLSNESPSSSWYNDTLEVMQLFAKMQGGDGPADADD